MATPDISRHATNFFKHWDDVRMQQGRVLTDDDFNESARLRAEEMRRTRLEVIGPAGSPDDGFLLKSSAAAGATFSISAGTFYLGGLRLTLEKDEAFELQSDWLNQTANDRLPAPTAGRFNFVWLEAWEQVVSAVEDSELLEVALGTDTSVRVRRMHRVRVLPITGDMSCRDAFGKLEGTVGDDLELTTDALLTVAVDPATIPPDLCSPPVQGGYSGAENQAIRVQITEPGKFTWGFDNAAPLYRVTVQGKVVTMLAPPKDYAHWPGIGQVVELIAWSALLPNGEKVAELSGSLFAVQGSYDPDTRQFTLATAPPATFGQEWTTRADQAQISAPADVFLYLRVWNRGADTNPALAIPFVAGTAVPLGNTGLAVTFSGTQFRPADFWTIAARPETPNVVVPWELSAGRPPHGVRRWRTPLGIIRWDANAAGAMAATLVDDCRPTFPPLTRLRTCCTYTVGDNVGSFGHFASIQEAINHLPAAEGGQVCVLPGRYRENVTIDKRANVTLHGCGRRSVIESKEGAPAGTAVISLGRGRNFRIEDLQIVAAEDGPGILVASESEPTGVTLTGLLIQAALRSGIEIQMAADVTIERCEVAMEDVFSASPGIFLVARKGLVERNYLHTIASRKPPELNRAAAPVGFGAARGGLQLGGGCRDVRVIDNLIDGGIGNGITLGSAFLKKDLSSGKLRLHLYWLAGLDGDCGECDPGDTYLGGPKPGRPPEFVSAGPLQAIRLERNRIFNMGLNGIGTLGFFEFTDQMELISVEGLSILGNEIRGCLRRPLKPAPPKMVEVVGYGGISLADVEELVIHDNVIAGNGPSQIEPVCGIFIFHAKGADLHRNRIVENGARGDQPDAEAKDGPRGGIYIVAAAAPAEEQGEFSFTTGEPAVRIHDNIVTAPLGLALRIKCLGRLSVQGNSFTTRGIARRSTAESFFAATIQIMGLGHSTPDSSKALLSLKAVSVALAAKAAPAPAPAPAGVSFVELDPNLILWGGDALRARPIPEGDVLFNDNQILLDLTDPRATGFADAQKQRLRTASIVIQTLGDISFQENQGECRLHGNGDRDPAKHLAVHAVIKGEWVRVIGNSLREGKADVVFSAVTDGNMNATTKNQTTHCLVINPSPAFGTVDSDNRVWAAVSIGQPKFCDQFGAV